MRRRGKFFIAALFSIVFTARLAAAAGSFDAEDPILGVREGWAWPVVVVMPPEGWDSPKGESVKLAMRTAEREISTTREAIRGREVTFMFSDVADASDLKSRLASWRAMKVAVIVTFADDAFNAALAAMCRDKGPSVIYAGGEGASIKSPDTGRPYPYLFALDLPYYARANALAEAAARERPGGRAAVFTDILSPRLARGAALTSRALKSRGMTPFDISATAYRHDQFSPQVRELESGGTDIYVCWLDAMAALSIWQSLERRHSGSVVYYSGPMKQILTDADGIVLVDKDVHIERNEEGRRDIIKRIRDAFDSPPQDPPTAAKAYALAKWTIGAYAEAGSDDAPRIALALSGMKDIPLMGETLSINPVTHRPTSRLYGLLRIAGRQYESHGTVEVLSAETEE
jgi:ABC-type branched-subunit amino acid transport system substrate-binding protein